MAFSTAGQSNFRFVRCDWDPTLAETDRRPIDDHVEHLSIGRAVHDLKNLLLGLDMLLTSALGGLRTQEPTTATLKQAQMACRDAQELCRNVLGHREYSAFAPTDLQRMDLRHVLNYVEPLLQQLVPNPATLRCEPGAQPLWIEGDRLGLARVVLNLVKNAGEALKTGRGSVTVHGGLVEMGGGDIANDEPRPTFAPGQYVYLKVSDTGCGMDESIVSQLFEQPCSKKSFGHGLGLLSVREIVCKHRGMIELRSAVDRGTTVRVLLPPYPRAPGNRTSPHKTSLISPAN